MSKTASFNTFYMDLSQKDTEEIVERALETMGLRFVYSVHLIFRDAIRGLRELIPSRNADLRKPLYLGLSRSKLSLVGRLSVEDQIPKCPGRSQSREEPSEDSSGQKVER